MIRRSGFRSAILALFGAQGLGYAISFVQVPILTRALSPEGFGVYAYCNLLILLLTTLIAWASNNTAILAFRRHANSPLRRSLVFWNQLGAQFAIAVAASLVIAAAIALIPELRREAASYALLIPFALANALYCPWIFSALERFRTLSRLGILTRLLGLALVAAFVRDRADLWLAVASVVLPNVAIAGLFVLLMWRERVILPVAPSRWRWRHVLAHDVFIAMSSLVVVVQGNAALLVAKFTLGGHDYGLLAFADRFRFIAQMVIGTLGLVLFSRYCSARLASRERGARIGRLSAAALVGSGGAIALLVALLAPWIVALLGGRHFAEALAPTLWMTAAMPIIGLNYYLTYFVLNVFGMARAQLFGLIALSLGAVMLMHLPALRTPVAVAALVVAVECARALIACAIIRRAGHRLTAPGMTLHARAA